nr:hypothetical protein [uncultured Pseudomonas sp.]
MKTLKITSLVLAGLMSAASLGAYAATGDGADATGTKSGSVGGSTMSPNNTPAMPSGGTGSGSGSTPSTGSGSGSGRGSGGSTGTNGGTSGSGAGGGTGAAGGGTGGAGGGTGS